MATSLKAFKQKLLRRVELQNQKIDKSTELVFDTLFSVTFAFSNGVQLWGGVQATPGPNEPDYLNKINQLFVLNYFKDIRDPSSPNDPTKMIKVAENSADFDFYVREITMPNVVNTRAARQPSLDDEMGRGDGGDFSIGLPKVVPASGMIRPIDAEITIKFWDTELSPIENFILPWMQEVYSPVSKIYKVSGRQPILNRTSLTADIYVNQLSARNPSKVFRRWKFVNAIPSQIDTPDFSADGGEEISTREVQFVFDTILVTNSSFTPNAIL